MEAKKTVISWERIRMLMADNDKHNRSGESRVEKYCEAQAEISFKAGYDKRESEFVYNPDYLDFQKGVEDGKIIGRQAGRREAKEWIYEENKCDGDVIYIDWDKLEDKLRDWFKDNPELLKEWGIAEETPFSPGYVDEH